MSSSAMHLYPSSRRTTSRDYTRSDHFTSYVRSPVLTALSKSRLERISPSMPSSTLKTHRFASSFDVARVSALLTKHTSAAHYSKTPRYTSSMSLSASVRRFTPSFDASAATVLLKRHTPTPNYSRTRYSSNMSSSAKPSRDMPLALSLMMDKMETNKFTPKRISSASATYSFASGLLMQRTASSDESSTRYIPCVRTSAHQIAASCEMSPKLSMLMDKLKRHKYTPLESDRFVPALLKRHTSTLVKSRTQRFTPSVNRSASTMHRFTSPSLDLTDVLCYCSSLVRSRSHHFTPNVSSSATNLASSCDISLPLALLMDKFRQHRFTPNVELSASAPLPRSALPGSSRTHRFPTSTKSSASATHRFASALVKRQTTSLGKFRPRFIPRVTSVSATHVSDGLESAVVPKMRHTVSLSRSRTHHLPIVSSSGTTHRAESSTMWKRHTELLGKFKTEHIYPKTRPSVSALLDESSDTSVGTPFRHTTSLSKFTHRFTPKMSSSASATQRLASSCVMFAASAPLMRHTASPLQRPLIAAGVSGTTWVRRRKLKRTLSQISSKLRNFEDKVVRSRRIFC